MDEESRKSKAHDTKEEEVQNGEDRLSTLCAKEKHFYFPLLLPPPLVASQTMGETHRGVPFLAREVHAQQTGHTYLKHTKVRLGTETCGAAK